jgi:hypothetical protein
MRICVFWNVKTVTSAAMVPYPFCGCILPSSRKVLVDTEKVIT